MRSRLVLKLFLLNALLCSSILGAIYAGQTLYFKDFYIERKTKDVLTSLNKLRLQLEADPSKSSVAAQTIREINTSFNMWTAILDNSGSPVLPNSRVMEVLANGTEGQTVTMRVPLHGLLGGLESSAGNVPFRPGTTILLWGVQTSYSIVPISIHDGTGGQVWENEMLRLKAEAKIVEVKKAYAPNNSESEQPALPIVNVKAKVLRILETPPLGTEGGLKSENRLFLERMSLFQTELLLGELKAEALQESDFTQNGANYKQFLLPVRSPAGEYAYILAIVSLQPVDDAVHTLQAYSIYIVGFVFILVMLASLYYAYAIARPLLRMNQAAKKLTELDFSVRIPAGTRDELGELAQNINTLSDALESHVGRLREDIEREKRLEDTRKAFIAGVSHELKTPLSVLKSCIAIIKDGVAGDKRDYYFEAMEKEVDRMDLLVVDMLELAKYESGTYRMELAKADLGNLADGVIRSITHEVRRKELQIKLVLDEACVLANPRLIEQVMMNFLVNAIQHTPRGGEITVWTGSDEGEGYFRVENQGEPIPPDQLDKVWERFYRGDPARAREDRGSGLGLAIAKQILELHGASYEAVNMADGVVFGFRLRT